MADNLCFNMTNNIFNILTFLGSHWSKWLVSGFPVPPSIRHSSGDLPVVLNVLVGKSVTLECESNAVPPPIITWYKNGRPITEAANLRILADGQILELRETEVCVRKLAGALDEGKWMYDFGSDKMSEKI